MATHLDPRAIVRAVTQRLISQAASWPAGYVVVPPTWAWPDAIRVAVRVETVSLATAPRRSADDDDVAEVEVTLALKVLEEESLDDAYTLAEAAGFVMKALRASALVPVTGQRVHLDEARLEPEPADEQTMLVGGTLRVTGNAIRSNAETLET